MKKFIFEDKLLAFVLINIGYVILEALGVFTFGIVTTIVAPLHLHYVVKYFITNTKIEE